MNFSFKNKKVYNLFLSLLPIFSFIYFYLSINGIIVIFKSKNFIKRILLIILMLEVFAALLTPNFKTSLSLTIIRFVFIYGLIGFGIKLNNINKLKYILYGYLFIYISSLALNISLHGYKLYNIRLSHLYYNSVSLGLSAVLGLFFVLYSNQLSWKLRIVIGILATIVLLLSGSRGALAAFVVGSIFAAIIYPKIYRFIFYSNIIIFGLILLFGYLFHIYPIKRLLNFTYLSNRDQIWHETIAVLSEHLWGGVGPYQLGLYIHPAWQNHGCYWLLFKYLFNSYCQNGLGIFDIARITAHNTLLHALAETGIVGTIGWILLYGLIGYAVWRARDPLLAAIFFGYMAMGLVDNPTAVPSYSLAEVFWISAGIALAKSGLIKTRIPSSNPETASKTLL